MNDKLTAREQRTLLLLSYGLTTEAIASMEFITEGAVKYRVRRIKEKLEARNRAQAIAIAVQEGIL